jgi:hypothetical protein
MRLKYSISSFPAAPDGYHAVAETVGSVSVIIDEATFVKLIDILPLEFAFFANRWLVEAEQNSKIRFYFKSMDEEEEPILAFDPVDEGGYVAISCWSDVTTRKLRVEEIRRGFSEFISSLRSDLKNRWGYDIDDAFRSFR